VQILPNVNQEISTEQHTCPGSVFDVLQPAMWTRLAARYGVKEVDGRQVVITYNVSSIRFNYESMSSRRIAEGSVEPSECGACQQAAKVQQEHNRMHFQDGYVQVRKKRSFLAYTYHVSSAQRVSCSCTTTVGDLKLLIMQHLDLQPCVQLLRCADKMLGPDTSTLLDHHICLGDIIEVEVVDEVEAAVVAGKLDAVVPSMSADQALAAAVAASTGAGSGSSAHAREEGFHGTTLQTSVFDSSDDLTDSTLLSSSPADMGGFLGSPTSRRGSGPGLMQSDEWRCARCTLHNKDSVSVCGACDASRPRV
jgi:hypothetical protein